MKFASTVLAAAALFATQISTPAQAIECRSADAHNSDDCPTVAAVMHMSQLLEQRSGGETVAAGDVVFQQRRMAPERLLMSRAVYDKLPKAEQDRVRAAAKVNVTSHASLTGWR